MDMAVFRAMSVCVCVCVCITVYTAYIVCTYIDGTSLAIHNLYPLISARDLIAYLLWNYKLDKWSIDEGYKTDISCPSFEVPVESMGLR